MTRFVVITAESESTDKVGLETSLSESGDKNIGSSGNATTLIISPCLPLFSYVARAFVVFL